MKMLNSVAVPTTSLEVKALQNLKYNCIEKDALMPLFLPLADENLCNGTGSFIDNLCFIYNNDGLHSGQIKEWQGCPDGAVEIEVEYDDGHIQNEVLAIPSNLDTLLAYYYGIGRYRKAAMIARKYKRSLCKGN